MPQENLIKALEHSSFKRTFRHGKYIFIEISKQSYLILHFGMTGYVRYFKDIQKKPSHTRLLIKFEDGYYLAIHNQRLFGKIGITNDIQKYLANKCVGHDAFRIDFDTFMYLSQGKTSMVKTALMNQSFIAGIGNIYSDEILFQSGIHPKTRINQLNRDELQNMFLQMKSILTQAIKLNANINQYPKQFIIPQRVKNGKCPIGSEPLATIKVNGRTTYFCPLHQQEK